MSNTLYTEYKTKEQRVLRMIKNNFQGQEIPFIPAQHVQNVLQVVDSRYLQYLYLY